MGTSFKALMTVAMVLCISACGWQLRGFDRSPNGQTKALPKTLNLQVMTHNSKMAQQVQKVLRKKDITVSSQAPLSLVLEDEMLDKRPLSVTDTGVTAQYQLTLTVRYHYQKQTDAQQPVLYNSRKVTSWRNYDFDAKLIVAKTQEEQALLQEMREELAYRILSDTPQSPPLQSPQ